MEISISREDPIQLRLNISNGKNFYLSSIFYGVLIIFFFKYDDWLWVIFYWYKWMPIVIILDKCFAENKNKDRQSR